MCMSVYVNVGGINYDNNVYTTRGHREVCTMECMIKTIINNSTNTENSTSLVRLKIRIHQCVCMSVYVSEWICVCVKNKATRLAPRRNGTKALGSGSWLCLLALALSSGSWPLHPSEGLETNGTKLWGKDLSLGSSPSSPITKHHHTWPHGTFQ